MRSALALACLFGVAACGGGLDGQASRGGGPSGGNGAGGLATGGAAGGTSRPPGILRVRGESIVDDTDTPVALRGVAFGNAVWSNVALPTASQTEVDYARVAAMGMNLIRFYLNYVTFEDDTAFFQYKPSGFEWVDQNVAWAKAHDIRLLLNMHVPQGGYQSNGGGTALWTDVANRDRLTALWTAIASYYRDEPTILGYDLVNEPVTATSKQEWVDLAQRLVGAIRQVDPYHIIAVERLNAVSGAWSNDADMNFFLVDDPNVLYEFHSYLPFEFTHQGASWVNCCQAPTSYPDETALTVSWADLTWKHWTWDGTPPSSALRIPDGDSPWTEYSVRYTVTDPTYELGRPNFMSQNNTGTVYFDDFVVNEYDPQGTFVREIWRVDPENAADWYFWLDTTNTPGAVGQKVQGADGHAGTRSVGIAGTTGDSSLSNDAYFFRVQQGNTYEIVYWARAENSAAGSQSLGRLDFVESKVPIQARDAAMLASEMDRFVAWGRAHQVPLFLGEFGCIKAAFDRGGLQWVGDMLDLAASRGYAWTYHDYHESAFGIYWGDYPTPPDPANANQPLIDLFTARLSR
jgi:endoglucanase